MPGPDGAAGIPGIPGEDGAVGSKVSEWRSNCTLYFGMGSHKKMLKT